ncbi:hypothetical protein OH492_07530 [Vibrio chagasii]|nr:hypothetical protein [Vibrio chagasii]
MGQFLSILQGFKLIVLAIGGYLAIKWHFDEDKRLLQKRAKRGEVFNTLSLKKKLVTALVITIVVTCLITLVVYATDWLL